MTTTRADPRATLVLVAGQRIFVVELEHVREVLRPLPTQPFGDLPYVLGVAILRGEPTPVIHLAMLLGTAEPSPPRRFAALRIGERQVALAVDAVLGVRMLDPDVLVELPPLLRASKAGYAERLALFDSHLALVLNGARVLPESLWDELEQTRGAR